MKINTIIKLLILILIGTTQVVNASSTSRGALWGGLTGAAIGGSAGGSRGAVIGGLSGAAIGSSIGASRDRQRRYEYIDQWGRPVRVRRVQRRPIRRVVW